MNNKVQTLSQSLVVAPAGSVLFSKYMVPEGTENFAAIEKVDGSSKLTFRKDALVLVDNLHRNGLTVQHIRLVREAREGVELSEKGGNTKWPRLRKACHLAGKPRIHQLGGFYPPIYQDEVAVPDYARSGAYGFIVKKGEISALLKTVPLSPEKLAELERMLTFSKECLKKAFEEKELLKAMGDHFWYDLSGHNTPEGVEWKRVSIVYQDGATRSFGFNETFSAGREDGDLSVYIKGWDRTVKYRSVPKGMADVVYDGDHRWLGLFDSDSLSVQAGGFDKVTLEFFAGTTCLKTLATDRATIVAKVQGGDHVKELEAEVARLERTIRGEKKRQAAK